MKTFNLLHSSLNSSLFSKESKVILVCVIFLLTFYDSNSQSLTSFFRYKGVQSLAELAHPTNTYKSGDFTIYADYFGVADDMIIVNIYYSDNYHTQLALRKQYGIFTKIAVVSDNDFVSPFAAVNLLKNIMLQHMKNNSGQSNSAIELKIESVLQRQLAYSNGLDLSLYILNLDWLKY